MPKTPEVRLEGQRSLAELRGHFDIVSSDLIPRIKELEIKNLVAKYNGKYRLTSVGVIVARRLQVEDNLTIWLEENARFLNEHNIAPIPTNLLCRIYELGKCKLIETNAGDINAIHRELYDFIPRSKFIMSISPIFDTNYPEFYLSLARQIPVSIITTETILNKVEKDYADTVQAYLKCDNAKAYIINDIRLLLVVTNEFISLMLFNNLNFLGFNPYLFDGVFCGCRVFVVLVVALGVVLFYDGFL